MKRSAAAPDLVHAAGGDLQARSEEYPNPEYRDHVWITMEAGSPERVTSAVNPLSQCNLHGALQFYFAEEQETALFLFKFCGQP